MEEIINKYNESEELVKALMKINELDGDTEEESIKMIKNFFEQKLMQ